MKFGAHRGVARVLSYLVASCLKLGAQCRQIEFVSGDFLHHVSSKGVSNLFAKQQVKMMLLISGASARRSVINVCVLVRARAFASIRIPRGRGGGPALLCHWQRQWQQLRLALPRHRG